MIMNNRNHIKSINVFCGSRMGNSFIYEAAAKELGKILAFKNIKLIYGGGGIGLMRAVADSVIQHKGEVVGVLPHFFDKHEVAHENVTEMIIVDSMSERKEKMAELSDAFIALPGGYGTLDELFEVLVYSQLSIHKKPVGILNTNGFYDALLQQLDRMRQEGFLYDIHQKMLIGETDPSILLEKICDFSYLQDGQWLDKIRNCNR